MNPGFPMPTYFPFQFAATGSHTSNEMCESLVGVANPATRQKGTETLSPAGVPNRPGVLGTSKSGGVLMDVAEVIVTFGIVSDAKLSQDCCAEAGLETPRNPASIPANKIACKLCFIWISPGVISPTRFALSVSGADYTLKFLARGRACAASALA